jgi:hemerythrin superfamily protein
MTAYSEPHRVHDAYPVAQPLETLKSDHRLVKQMFERYFMTQDRAVKSETGPRILMLLEMHAALEEAIFYVRVREADPTLIDACDAQHQHAIGLIERLKGMEEGDPQCEDLFRQLADAVLHHIDIEERQLFPKVERSGLDLAAIGIEMQSFESTILDGRKSRMPHADTHGQDGTQSM